MACNNLANLLADLNRPDEAESFYREALEIYRRLADANPQAYRPLVAKVCNNLAIFLNKLGRSEEAQRYRGC
ncbi:tetratricopeptide repeat-containing protein [Gordonibacter sp.]|uniref:tetratricopeptide repeat-containing protein n=1 Tax=Gordonibacter sp. TaxID=1968902 RepID=UPI001F8889C4|nr:tetratricopeptide repeat-containing protein [Gordonibacter sp.]HIW75905.1 tetratricopeptide repeat-containing protein [Candidatus Gordonibacter avicola]